MFVYKATRVLFYLIHRYFFFLFNVKSLLWVVSSRSQTVTFPTEIDVSKMSAMFNRYFDRKI